MLKTDRKSSTAHFRNFLHEMDYLVDQFRTGAISEEECKSLYSMAFVRLQAHVTDNFGDRIHNSRFFREPSAEPGLGALPVDQAEGQQA